VFENRSLQQGEITDAFRKMARQAFDCVGCTPVEANAEVAPIHPKAMPVILTDEDEVDVWLNAPAQIAMELQRPLANGLLKIVARGARQDDGG
jgi:putative SOS response-associated peptidase YedK